MDNDDNIELDIMQDKKIILTLSIIDSLHRELVDAFEKFYSITSQNLPIAQLYGFGDYSEKLPGLKKFIYEKTRLFINGKYLYTKLREARRTKKNIFFSREYAYIFFKVLGYASFEDFLKRSPFVSLQDKQIINEEVSKKEKIIYAGYYHGENQELIKTTLEIDSLWKHVVVGMYYQEEDKKLHKYVYHGIITFIDGGNFDIYFSKHTSDTKFSAYMTLHCGAGKHAFVKILAGTYAGINKDFAPVCGAIVFQRMNEQEANDFLNSTEPPIEIIDLLYNKRIESSTHILSRLSQLAQNSTYSILIKHHVGIYYGIYLNKHNDLTAFVLRIGVGYKNSSIQMKEYPLLEGYMRMGGSSNILIGDFYEVDADHFQKTSLCIETQESKSIPKGYYQGYLSGINNTLKPFSVKIVLFKEISTSNQPKTNWLNTSAKELISLVESKKISFIDYTKDNRYSQ